MKKIILWSVMTLLVSGCVKDRVAEVEAEMKQIRDKPAKPIEQPPVFEQVKSFNYSASNLRSPFMPPSLAQRLLEEQQSEGSSIQPDLDRPTEQLEAFDLAQLIMKGIMQDQSGERYALVEDPTGTIFPARIGNYMGKNHGRIVDITARQIDLIEIVPDGTKGYVERPKTILSPESESQ